MRYLINFFGSELTVYIAQCENNGCNMLAAAENRYLVARLENEIHDALAAQEVFQSKISAELNE